MDVTDGECWMLCLVSRLLPLLWIACQRRDSGRDVLCARRLHSTLALQKWEKWDGEAELLFQTAAGPLTLSLSLLLRPTNRTGMHLSVPVMLLSVGVSCCCCGERRRKDTERHG